MLYAYYDNKAAPGCQEIWSGFPRPDEKFLPAAQQSFLMFVCDLLCKVLEQIAANRL